MFTKKECLNCKNIFNAPDRELKRGNAQFCSISCANIYRHKNIPKPKPNVNCANCHKAFYIIESRRKGSKSGLFFCCRKCKDAAQRIGGIKEIQPSHYGTGKPNHRLIASILPKRCNRCSYNEFPEILHVHHKDRNYYNVNIDNLEILCPNCHAEEHLHAGDGLFHNNKKI